MAAQGGCRSGGAGRILVAGTLSGGSDRHC